MRRNIPTISVILLLGILVLCSACTSGNEKTLPDGGLSQVATQELPATISFEEAIQEFRNYNSISGSAENVPVYYLISKGVDGSGNASSWMFGVYQENRSVLLVYDRTGWSINPWNVTLPQEEIPMNTVLPPSELFKRNTEALSNLSAPQSPESRELILKEGVYTLTLRSGSTTRALMFNATTGGLITDHVS